MQFQKTQVGEGRLMMVDNGATEGVDFVVLVRFLIPTSFGLKICKLHTQKLYNLALPPLLILVRLRDGRLETPAEPRGPDKAKIAKTEYRLPRAVYKR